MGVTCDERWRAGPAAGDSVLPVSDHGDQDVFRVAAHIIGDFDRSWDAVVQK